MTRHESCSILGNTIDLGEVDYIIQKGIFKIVEKGATKIKLTITLTEDCPAKAFYEKYYNNKLMQGEPVSSTSPSLS
jgi:metal-sulfur cluster biosynthetic enzyme